MIQANSVKRTACVIKLGIYCDNILSVVANLLSVANTMEESTDSILQAIMPLSSDSLKDAFIHMGGKIIDLLDLKK